MLLHKKGVEFRATIVGDSSDPHASFARELRALAKPLIDAGVLRMRGAVPNRQALSLYQENAIYCNLSPNGMFDKTIGEAAACGCVPVACNESLKSVMPQELFLSEAGSESLAKALKHALALSFEQRTYITPRVRAWVVREHSLSRLIPSVLSHLYEAVLRR